MILEVHYSFTKKKSTKLVDAHFLGLPHDREQTEEKRSQIARAEFNTTLALAESAMLQGNG